MRLLEIAATGLAWFSGREGSCSGGFQGDQFRVQCFIHGKRFRVERGFQGDPVVLRQPEREPAFLEQRDRRQLARHVEEYPQAGWDAVRQCAGAGKGLGQARTLEQEQRRAARQPEREGARALGKRMRKPGRDK